MAVSNGSYYKPDEALHELMIQETILNVAVDVKAIFEAKMRGDIK